MPHQRMTPNYLPSLPCGFDDGVAGRIVELPLAGLCLVPLLPIGRSNLAKLIDIEGNCHIPLVAESRVVDRRSKVQETGLFCELV